jgi:cytochrome c biogenesis protein CcmG/thiol:disulfide interchange protein DsbE
MSRLLRPVPIIVLVGAIGLIALLAFGVSGRGSNRGLDQAIAAGERATPPRLDLPPLDGKGPHRTLDDYRGKVVVLNVWASWCVPCRQESPLLEKWHRQILARGGTVIGVDTQDIASDARDFIGKFGLTYPQLRDKQGDQMNDWGTIAYPETFVIDRDGKVVAIRRGPVDDVFMHEAVAPLLEEQ